VGIKDGNLDIKFDITPGEAVHKLYTFDVPRGCSPDWWESTHDNSAGHDQHFDSEKMKFTVDLWVSVRAVAGPRNWVGLRFRCHDDNVRDQPRMTDADLAKLRTRRNAGVAR
jgi:hypothetical protein